MEGNSSTDSSVSSVTEYINTLHIESEMETSTINSVNVDWDESDKHKIINTSEEIKELNENSARSFASAKVKGFRKMYLAALVALMNSVCMGYGVTYSAMATYDMEHRDDSLVKPTTDQVGWIGSLLAVGALFGGMIAGHLTESVGRKGLLLFSTIPFILGWMLIAFATSVSYLYAGRIVVGLCCGLVSVTTPMYLVEISTPDVRGLLGASFQLFVTIGIVIVSCFGAAMTWSWLALGGAVFSVLTLLGMVFVPESPRWLMAKGRKDEALWTIHCLQGGYLDAQKEGQSILNDIENQPKGSFKFTELISPVVYKPAILSCGLMIFQQCSGVNAVLFYTANIFKKAGSSMDAIPATIIVSVVQVIATVISSVLMDKAGRKILLLVSGSFMALSHIVFGVFDYIAVRNETFRASYGWLPLVCVILYISAFSLGYGPIPWLMVSEMTSARFRSATSGFATALNWTLAFTITKTFHYMEEGIQGYGTYWTYAGMCALSCFFTFFLLPETKGKQIDEILSHFTPKTDDATVMKTVVTNASA